MVLDLHLPGSKSSGEDKKGRNMCSSARLLQCAVSVPLSYHIHVSPASCGMNLKLLSLDRCDSVKRADDQRASLAVCP